MLSFLDEILDLFKDCFSRESTFKNFKLMILRQDVEGLTSVVRAFPCGEKLYRSLAHFCHSEGFDPLDLLETLCEILSEHVTPVRIEGRIILIGDGVKVPKTGRFMALLKFMRQCSQDSYKKEFSAPVRRFMLMLPVTLSPWDVPAALPGVREFD